MAGHGDGPDNQRMPAWLRGWEIALVVAIVWVAGTAVGLASTLESLRTDDFDGLNNMLQIPFALPWFLIPIGTSDHVRDAWVVAAMGLANAVILFIVIASGRASDRER